MPDFTISNHGSILLVRPLNDEARDFLEQRTGDEAQWFAGALAVEPRYALGIVMDLRDEQGFDVEFA